MHYVSFADLNVATLRLLSIARQPKLIWKCVSASKEGKRKVVRRRSNSCSLYGYLRKKSHCNSCSVCSARNMWRLKVPLSFLLKDILLNTCRSSTAVELTCKVVKKRGVIKLLWNMVKNKEDMDCSLWYNVHRSPEITCLTWRNKHMYCKGYWTSNGTNSNKSTWETWGWCNDDEDAQKCIFSAYFLLAFVGSINDLANDGERRTKKFL